MALSYGFFNAQLDSDGNYDRIYQAEHFAEYFHLFVGNGVFPDGATQLQVVSTIPASMKVSVSAGFGWINGYYAKNTDDFPLTIDVAHVSLPRQDIIVLRWVNETRSMELAVKKGTAASSPVIPALTRNADVYEIMLASISIAAGATSISQSVIIDKRPDTSVCGWVTGLIDQIDTTNLFAQYNTAFNEWFDNVKEQLSGNVATNLQRQIDELNDNKVNVSDKATVEEAKEGTNDTKWMTPAKVNTKVSDSMEPLLASFTNTNIVKLTQSCSWYAPTDLPVPEATVICVGGGGGGGGTSSTYGGNGGGGGGGYIVAKNVTLIPGKSYSIVIGAGGYGGSGSGNDGRVGGTTSFGDLVSAEGGSGGKGGQGGSSGSSTYNGGAGGAGYGGGGGGGNYKGGSSGSGGKGNGGGNGGSGGVSSTGDGYAGSRSRTGSPGGTRSTHGDYNGGGYSGSGGGGGGFSFLDSANNNGSGYGTGGTGGNGHNTGTSTCGNGYGGGGGVGRGYTKLGQGTPGSSGCVIIIHNGSY